MGKLSSAKNLTKAEKYSIQGMVNNGMDSNAISKALDRDEDLVAQYIEVYNKEKAQTTINKTANGNRGVAIMTAATSERVDGMRGKNTSKQKNHSAIHNIK